MAIDIQMQWNELNEEYKKLEEEHQIYLKLLKEVTSRQNACLAQIHHQRYRLKGINKSPNKNNKECMKREAELQLIEETLPRQGGWYLKLILGNINLSFLSEEAKFKYKDEYEKFKLIFTIIATVLVILNMLFTARFFQKMYLFFLVWYYCTVTIRESILRANGSKIKLWWRVHHGLSVLASIVLLVWPENSAWDDFKRQFFRYNLYSCLVQYLQFNYQRGALYRLRALGQKNNMDITIEGFQYWMWRGLAFLYPFLFAAYIYQLVNAYALYKMYKNHPESTWHILATSVFMLIFFIGNSITTLLVIPAKIKNKMFVQYKFMCRKLLSFASDDNFGVKNEKSN